MKRFWIKKNNGRTIKRACIFKGFASYYNVEILNYFTPELQHQDTAPEIKNKLIDLFTQWF